MKFKHTACYIPDYPRPQMVRKQWTNLNGEWDFCFDDGTQDCSANKNGFDASHKIRVPFAYQCEDSGIGCVDQYPTVWYQRDIDLSFDENQRVLLQLEGSDYVTEVFVNGISCGVQHGAYHRQAYDLTDACVQGTNKLVIRVDDSYDPSVPRGKQRSFDRDYGCWYVGVSGLYKTAWLEVVNRYRVNGFKLTPNTEQNVLSAEFDCALPSNDEFFAEHDVRLTCVASFEGEQVASVTTRVMSTSPSQNIWLGTQKHLWGVGEPNLYDLAVTLSVDGVACDEIGSYFGMRKIEYGNGEVLLNDAPLYQKLILDQGYWHTSNITPPSEAALEKDIDDMLAMGFNGCRKHQKVEDERFLYHADIRGYIVWAEMPSAYTRIWIDDHACQYAIPSQTREDFANEWMLAVKQQYNHACVLCWVPINESWGVEDILFDKAQQDYANELYCRTAEYDPMRPIITNDGWEHTISDYLTIHHYTQSGAELEQFFNTVDKCTQRVFDGHHKGAFADGYAYDGQPILISEFGGTSFVKDLGGNKWGYGEAVRSDEEFIARFASLIDGIYANPHVKGFCYTQLSDVFHEVNGLMTFDRKPKEPFATIKAILDKGPKN